MSLLNPGNILDDDVFILTGRGMQELQAAETTLSSEALRILVLTDGRSTVVKTLTRSKLEADVFYAVVNELIRESYIDLASNQLTRSLDFREFFDEKSRPPSTKAVELSEAEAESEINTLQRQGYFVRIVRRPHQAMKIDKKPKVLIIEDVASLAMIISKYLEIEGCTTASASNKAEIVSQLNKSPVPDLVILDVLLPDADGFDVLLRMRAHPMLKNVPVLMLTAKATRESVLKALAAGANGYLTKPFYPNALVHAVRTVLGMPRILPD